MGTKREDRVDGSGALTAARQWLSMDCSHPGCSSTVLQAAQRLKNQANTKSMTRNLRIKPAPSAWPSVYSSSRPYLKHSVNFHSVLLQVPDAKGLTLQWATHGVRSGTALSFTHSYFDHKRRFAELFVCRTDSAWLITTPLPSLMHILPALMHWDHHCWPISSPIILPRSCQQPGNKRKPAEKMNEQKYQDPVPSYPLLSGWGHNCHLEKQLPWRCERNMITTLPVTQDVWNHAVISILDFVRIYSCLSDESSIQPSVDSRLCSCWDETAWAELPEGHPWSLAQSHPLLVLMIASISTTTFLSTPQKKSSDCNMLALDALDSGSCSVTSAA